MREHHTCPNILTDNYFFGEPYPQSVSVQSSLAWHDGCRIATAYDVSQSYAMWRLYAATADDEFHTLAGDVIFCAAPEQPSAAACAAAALIGLLKAISSGSARVEESTVKQVDSCSVNQNRCGLSRGTFFALMLLVHAVGSPLHVFRLCIPLLQVT